MSSLRIKVSGLLSVVLLASMAFAALRSASDSWDRGVLALTLLALLSAVVLAVHRTDRHRAYWLGFVLVDGTYLGASLVPQIEYRLPATRALVWAESRLHVRPELIHESGLVPGPGGRGNTIRSLGLLPDGRWVVSTGDVYAMTHRDARTGKLVGSSSGTSENFLRIGHSLLAVAVAFIGGGFARFLYSQTRRSGESPETAV
jgi:hypothetical protein